MYVCICVLLYCCVCVVVDWNIGIAVYVTCVYLCIGVVFVCVHWCICTLGYWCGCMGIMMHLCRGIGVLVCYGSGCVCVLRSCNDWSIGVGAYVYWRSCILCIGVLMDWCGNVVVYWYRYAVMYC